MQLSKLNQIDESEEYVKNTNLCPKCHSKNLIIIPGKHHGYGAGNIIMVGFTFHIKVTRYLCEDCGYIEEWIEDKKDIQKLKDKYN